MKGIISLWISIVIVLSGCKSAKPITTENQLSQFQFTANTKPAISAHRGGGDYPQLPENSIASFEKLAVHSPMIIECDINLTKDSVLVMMHDDKLDRTSNGTGKISELPYSYLQTLKLKDNMGNPTNDTIPTLNQVLAWGKGKVSYTLDVKRSVPFELVVNLVKQYRAQSYAAIITYNAQDAAKVHKLDPNVMISVTIRSQEEYDRHQALGIPDNRMIAFVGTREPNEALCQMLHKKGIRCILGTLGNLDKMAAARGDQLYRNWVEKGADILSTDRPIEAYKAIQ